MAQPPVVGLWALRVGGMRLILVAIALSAHGALLRAGTQDVQDVYYVGQAFHSFIRVRML